MILRRLALLLVFFLISINSFAPNNPSYCVQNMIEKIVEDIKINKQVKSYNPEKIQFSMEFKRKLVKISTELNIKVEYLLTLFHIETIGSFDPSEKSPIGATGLIQFTSSTAKWLGTSTYELSKMSRVEQLDYVEKYLKGIIKYYGELTTLEDVFMAVHYPRAIRKSLYATVYQSGSRSYHNNRFNDRNKDGKVTKYEICNFVRKVYNKYYKV
jgi:hypothetical protein